MGNFGQAKQPRLLSFGTRCFHHGDVETSMALHAIEGPVAGQIFFVGAGVLWLESHEVRSLPLLASRVLVRPPA